MKELVSPVAPIGGTVRTATVAWVPHQSILYVRLAERMLLLTTSLYVSSPGIPPKECGRLQGQLGEDSLV